LQPWNVPSTWLEQNWPYLLVALPRAKSPADAIAAMKNTKERMEGVFQPPFYHRLEQFEEQLWSFLKSGRFRGNPRNLAAAMAGLPELSWKRSFDVCSAHPLKGGVILDAMWDYMKRNFPDRLRELSEVHTPEQVRMVLSRSRTHDLTYNHLKQNPDKALGWLNAGKPQSS
jgi:hypothetical protein